MLHLKEGPTGRAAVDDRVQRILFFTLIVDALKPGSIWHRLYLWLFVFAEPTLSDSRALRDL